MEETITIDAICREYMAKAKPGTPLAEGISFSPLETVAAVWVFLVSLVIVISKKLMVFSFIFIQFTSCSVE